MSVINATPLIAAGDDGYQISRSVRIRNSASAYFNRTPSVTTSTRTQFTFSAWVKRGLPNATVVYNTLLSASSGSSTDYTSIQFANCTTDDQLVLNLNGYQKYYTNAVFRDYSAWYHVIVVFDSNATAGNRVIFYVNGVRQTTVVNNEVASGASHNFGITTNSMNIGRHGSNAGWTSWLYADCYMTEVNYIDSQALTPSSFGENDVLTGVWKPKKYAGTYGTNGFYLNFSDNSAATAAAIGKDSSGNGNNWTPNNISVTTGVTYDSMIDTPTPYADGGNGRGNYAVMNPLSANQMNGGTVSVTNGNLTVADGATSYGVAAQGTIAVTSGKWYWEVTASTVGGSYGACGIRLSTLNGTDGAGYFYFSDGTKVTTVFGGGAAAYGASYTSGDVIGVALDMDGGTIAFYKNNTSQGTAYTGLSGSFNACVGDGQNSTQYVWNVNFGQRPFSYTPPTGFKALNTQNMAVATINNGAQYMAATLYTGNGTAVTVVNSGGFAPDLVWTKARGSTTGNHVLGDTVRGTGKVLCSDLSNAEISDAQTYTAFNSNGFSYGNEVSGNRSGNTMVSWQWKETPTAGFDIVPYTFGSTGIATISHNLGVAPKMIIAKRLNAVEQWLVYQSSATTQSQYLGLNTTAAVASSANLWGSTPFSSSQFYFNATTGYQYIFYCFADVAGFSKFGSYTGNGSTDGPFVYLGFRPRYIMVKNASTGGAGYNWTIVDTARQTYNNTATDPALWSNLSDVESNGWGFDFLSNGFKIRSSGAGTNGSGNTIIYMAFAENPFKNSLAR